jgi:plastocyanin
MTSRFASALLVAAGLAIAGCGDDDGGSADATAPTTQSSTTTDKVEIVDFTFAPETIEVAAGTEVTWTNADTSPHTATADDASFDTGDLDKGDSARITFKETGSFTYYCRFHPNMKATVQVE